MKLTWDLGCNIGKEGEKDSNYMIDTVSTNRGGMAGCGSRFSRGLVVVFNNSFGVSCRMWKQREGQTNYRVCLLVQ